VFEKVIAVNLTGTMRICQRARPLLAKTVERSSTSPRCTVSSAPATRPAMALRRRGRSAHKGARARVRGRRNPRQRRGAWLDQDGHHEPVFSDPARSAAVVDRTPLSRWGEPRDVAGPVLSSVGQRGLRHRRDLTVDGGTC